MARNKLTTKQQAFALAYYETGSSGEAYRRSYNCDGMNENAIAVEGSKLLKHPIVGAEIERLSIRRQTQADAKGLLTLEEHMEELRVLREAAKTKGQISAAIQAEVKRGELRKFYIKQVEVGGVGEFEQMPTDDLDKFIFSEAKAILDAEKPSRVAASKAKH